MKLSRCVGFMKGNKSLAPSSFSLAEGNFTPLGISQIPNGFISLQKALAFASAFCMAGAEGLEPSTKVLETHVLPLHHAPTQRLYYTRDSAFCQPFIFRADAP